MIQDHGCELRPGIRALRLAAVWNVNQHGNGPPSIDAAPPDQPRLDPTRKVKSIVAQVSVALVVAMT